MSAAPSIRRMHFNAEGAPKVKLSIAGAKRARARGQRTYLCPICGGVHAGGTTPEPTETVSP